MFWPEARILRLAKASQGCLAFAVVHSPMATESVGENGRGAASKKSLRPFHGSLGHHVDPIRRAPAGRIARPKLRRLGPVFS